MKNGIVDNEKTIRELIAKTEDLRYIEVTKKALSKKGKFTDDDVLFISAMLLGEAIKRIIPERQYKRLTIKLWPENGRGSDKTLGCQYEENGKYVVEYNCLNHDTLRTDEYDFVDKLQPFFTFAHELYHTKQAIDAQDENITFDSFMYCLEAGLKENVPGFYKKEYDNLYMETSAEGVGIIMTSDFLEKYGVLKREDMPKFSRLLIQAFKPKHHVFANDEELKEYIKRLLKILRDNIHTFSRKFDEDVFIKYPMLKYLINRRTGELESPERLQELLDNTYMEKENSDTNGKRRLLKILKELSIERQQSFSQK